VEQILKSAEAAVQTAKEQGRNRVVQCREEERQADAYRSLEAASIAKLKKTLQTDSFVLRAQPIVRNRGDVKSARVFHYEVLLGLKNEKGELESPQDFIVEAERFGHMVDVDRWVINQVFSWISQQMDEQKQIPYLAINISGTSITDDNFMDYLLEQISEYGVGTNRLCFEITETGTISNMVKAGDFVRELKNIGCRFAIDDFGTGLASHNYLRELPVDLLKIDGTFISKIHENDRDYAMVKSINDLAHFLGQETIAEFVENDDIIDRLREIGVDYLQGWGVGKPILFDDLTKTLEALEK
jgi:EAL domain-containing protein (putative c-di-GMP-specific phosphodiesterase class I)